MDVPPPHRQNKGTSGRGRKKAKESKKYRSLLSREVIMLSSVNFFKYHNIKPFTIT